MDSSIMIGFVLVFMIVLLLASRQWIAMALGAVGIFGLYFFTGGNTWSMIGEVLYNYNNKFTFTMIALFVAMGEIIQQSGISKKLYDAASLFVRNVPGRLLHANIITCAIFSAIAGSSLATVATIGAVALPELERRGYPKRLMYGSVVGGGTLGILIPPSIGLVIYGAFVGESIGQLFIGAIIPGIMLSLMFMLYIITMCVLWPNLNPPKEEIVSNKSGSKSIFKNILLVIEAWPFVLLIFMVLGTIYLGVATPTEAAAMGFCFAIILAIIFRRLNWEILKSSLLSTLKTTSFIMILMTSAYLLSMAFSMEKIPTALAIAVANLSVSKYVLWAFFVLMYIFIGTFIDGLSMLLLTLPVVYPIMMSQGFDSVWLGVALIICVEMGQITPPVGINIYAVQGISGKENLRDIILGSLPFFFMQLIGITIITIFPTLITWLPSMMIKKF